MNFMLFSSKGGTGKTPFAVSLAISLATDTYDRIGLIDFDGNQASATHILQNRLMDNPERPKGLREAAALPVVEALAFDSSRNDLDMYMRMHTGNYSHLVFDTGGYDSQFNRKLMQYADVMIIPIRPQASDHWALVNMLTLFQEMHEGRMTLPQHIFVVFTQCSAHNSHKADVRKDIDDLNAYLQQHSFGQHIVTLNNATIQRHTYNQAAEWGLGITEAGNEKAASEFIAVYKEMLTRLLSKPGTH